MNRRRFIRAVAAGGTGLALAGCSGSGPRRTPSTVTGTGSDGVFGGGNTDGGAGDGSGPGGAGGSPDATATMTTATATAEPTTTAVWTPAEPVKTRNEQYHFDSQSVGREALVEYGEPFRIVFSFEVLEGQPIHLFLMNREDFNEESPVGLLGCIACAEDRDITYDDRVAYIKEHAVPELTFWDARRGRGEAALDPGIYKFQFTQAEKTQSGTVTFEWSYKLYEREAE